MIEKLSPHQLKVVRLLADGLTHKEIAAELGSTPGAVEIVSRRARWCVGAANGVQLVAIAIREGWIK